MKKLFLLLPDIRSVHNVGSIFRTADAVGVEKIYLSGTTPMPLDRFGRERSDLAKVALGAEKSIAWEYIESNEKLMKSLKEDGIKIVALEQTENSVSYLDMKFEQDTLLILGSEVGGISNEILSLADGVYEIPMSGKKESLNVSVAAGIAMFKMKENEG